MSRKIIKEHDQYTISHSDSDLLFTWKHIAGLTIEDMAKGITDFANHCKKHKPNVL